MMKIIWLFLSLLLLAGVGLVGCSDDTQRITSPASSELNAPVLGLSDDPGDESWVYDFDDFVTLNDYLGDTDQDDAIEIWTPGGHDYPDIDDPLKPLDNGLDAE
jgi:hypothetical protein